MKISLPLALLLLCGACSESPTGSTHETLEGVTLEALVPQVIRGYEEPLIEHYRYTFADTTYRFEITVDHPAYPFVGKPVTWATGYYWLEDDLLYLEELQGERYNGRTHEPLQPQIRRMALVWGRAYVRLGDRTFHLTH